MNKKNKQIKNYFQAIDKIIVLIIIFIIITIGGIWYYQTFLYTNRISITPEMQKLINKKNNLEKQIQEKTKELKKNNDI